MARRRSVCLVEDTMEAFLAARGAGIWAKASALSNGSIFRIGAGSGRPNGGRNAEAVLREGRDARLAERGADAARRRRVGGGPADDDAAYPPVRAEVDDGGRRLIVPGDAGGGRRLDVV